MHLFMFYAAFMIILHKNWKVQLLIIVIMNMNSSEADTALLVMNPLVWGRFNYT